MCLVLRVVLLPLVQRERLDQLQRHRRDGQSVGLPVVPVLQPVGEVNLRLSTNEQLIPGCSNKLRLSPYNWQITLLQNVTIIVTLLVPESK